MNGEAKRKLEDLLGDVYQLEVIDDEGVDVPYDMLCDPEWSAGFCVAASEALPKYLKDRGIDEVEIVDGKREGVPHTWNEVRIMGSIFIVDLTAAQFGCEDPPLIIGEKDSRALELYQSKSRLISVQNHDSISF